MRRKKKNLSILFFVGLYCLIVLSGCASEKKSSSDENLSMGDTQASADMAHGTYKPSDLTIPTQDTYEYSYMGLKFSLPESLMERMDNKEIAMIDVGDVLDDETKLQYEMIIWKSMTKEQREEEVESNGNEFYDWMDSLTSVGAIGVYQEKAVEQMDTLTGCTEHKEIGKSEDGLYTYYLSVNSEAEDTLKDEINHISYEITEMIPLEETSEGSDTAVTGNVGEFSMKDIEGETYTQDMFAEYDLTMVNVFTTWCSPCVNEIPDLEKLKNEMSDKGVNVVGIVLDTIDGNGMANEEIVEKAKLLAEKTGATYPFLIPDEGYLNGRLIGIEAVPETFFVDKEGNIVGETYSGSHTLEDWKNIVESELKEVAQ